MDLDALAKDFYRFKPMLDEMKLEYDAHVARRAARPSDPEPAVDAELHAAIHAPLHDSDETIAARQVKADADHLELDEAAASRQAEADAKAEAERIQAEADEADAQVARDRAAAEALKNAPVPGQNQGPGEGNAPEGGNPPENAGEATPEPSLTEPTVATDQGSTAKPVG